MLFRGVDQRRRPVGKRLTQLLTVEIQTGFLPSVHGFRFCIAKGNVQFRFNGIVIRPMFLQLFGDAAEVDSICQAMGSAAKRSSVWA